MRHLSYLCLLLLAVLLGAPDASGEEIRWLEDLQPHWAKQREAFAAVTIFETLQKLNGVRADGVPWQSSIRELRMRNGLSLNVVVQRRRDPPHMLLANDTYDARLTERPAGSNNWTSDSLHLFSPHRDTPADREATDAYQSHWSSPPGLSGVVADISMLDPRWCRIESVATDKTGMVTIQYAKHPHVLPDDSPLDPKLPPAVLRAQVLLKLLPSGEFVFDPAHDYAIARFKGTSPTGRVRTEEFTDFRQIDEGVWYPKEAKGENIDGPGLGSLKWTRSTIRFETAPLNGREFVLSNYGLPEPPARVAAEGAEP